jgi:hypothetical protein
MDVFNSAFASSTRNVTKLQEDGPCDGFEERDSTALAKPTGLFGMFAVICKASNLRLAAFDGWRSMGGSPSVL